MMAGLNQTDIAIRLATYLLKVRTQIEDSDDYKRESPFALSLYVIAITVQAAIFNGRLLEFAEHCFAFTSKMAAEEDQSGIGLFNPADHPSADPSSN